MRAGPASHTWSLSLVVYGRLWKMVHCQAIGCNNDSSRTKGRSYFSIPDPKKERERCGKWIAALKSAKFSLNTYKYDRNNVVCSDHFEASCFVQDLRAELCGRKVRKTLKDDAIPTIFQHRGLVKMRESSERRFSKRHTQQLVDNLLQPSTSSESAASFSVEGGNQTATLESASVSSLPSPALPVLPPARSNSRDIPCSRTTPIQQAIQNSKEVHKPSSSVQESSVPVHGAVNDPAHQAFPNPLNLLKSKEVHETSSSIQKTSFPKQGAVNDPAHQASPNPLDLLYPVQPSHETLQHQPDRPDPPKRVLLSLKKTNQPASPNKRVRFDTSHQLKDHNYFRSARDDPSLHETSSQRFSQEFPGESVDGHQNEIPLLTSSALSSAEPSDLSSAEPSDLSSAEPSCMSSPEPSAMSSPELYSMPSSPSLSQSSSSSSSDIPSSGNRKSDTSYTMSSESSSESDTDDEVHKYCSESKYMVFESQLDKLLYALKCDKCDGGHITELKKNVVGTLLAISAICVCGNTVTRWESQPRIGQMPVGNVLCTSSAFFSGGTQGSIDFFLSLLNLQNVSKTKFYDTQKNLVLSATNAAYTENIAQVRRELCGNDGITICGDGRCDSPGYNAKYCSYTFMHMGTNKIIAMSLVQVTEATSSVAMEKLAFQRALDELLQAGCRISTIATDRHMGIRKLVREEYPDIDHQFDVWHMSKSIVKKLTAKSKRKECEGLGPWIRAISNHLWWSATNCKGDGELLVEMWQSITHHVCNVHTWNSAEKYHECAHAPIDPTKERKIKWLTPDSPAHIAIQEVLFDKILVKDLKHLTKACRTGELESYHSMLLKYAPKRQEFDFPVMLARLQLAVLDHNNNVEREYATVKHPKPGASNKGEQQLSHRYSKKSKVWTTTDKKVKKKYDYLNDMQVHLLQMQNGSVEVQEVPLPDLPQNIAPVPRPSVEELLAQRYRRFKP